MRLGSSPVLLLLCACGNLSNEDVAFLEAIPQKQQLHVAIPQGSTSQNLCTNGAADVYASAKSTGTSINAGVDDIVALVDAIRKVTPTTRDVDSRTWGPSPDNDHEGVFIQVAIARDLDARRTPPRFIYTLSDARPAAACLPNIE